MPLKFKKNFHNYLSTYTHGVCKKERREKRFKQSKFFLASVQYKLCSKKKKSGSTLYKLEINKRARVLINSMGSEKMEKLTSVPSVY